MFLRAVDWEVQELAKTNNFSASNEPQHGMCVALFCACDWEIGSFVGSRSNFEKDKKNVDRRLAHVPVSLVLHRVFLRAVR
jgi:hypothetical protein